jgi:streptogramin lyase
MSRDFATIKYDGASGDELWVTRYSGESTGSYDYGNDLAFDSSGNVYVTGRSGGSGTYYDAASATIKYDSAGNQLWIARYKGPGDSFIGTHCISVNAIGEVYVGGMGFGIGTGIDFIVLKYRQ